MSKRIALKVFILIFSFLTFYVSPSSWALVVRPDINFIDFRFNNPGARANAMGGAFVGVADDATAAFTNPAGLTVLTRPEVSVEFKYTEVDTTAYSYAYNATDYWTYEKDLDQTAMNASFISGVFPQDKTTLAVYRHQLLDIEYDFKWAPRSAGRQYYIDIDIITYGVGMGIQLSNTFSVGLSIGFAQLDYYYIGQTFSDTTYTSPELAASIVDSVDNSEQYTLALLWNPFSEFNIGAVYRYGPEFETSYLLVHNQMGAGWSARNTLKIPDVYSLGMSYLFFSALTAAVDVNYVKYSDLKKDLVFWGSQASYIDIEDTTEVHAGLEYAFELGDIPFALRCGYFYMPQHNFVYVGPVTDNREAAWNEILSEGDDEHIFSAGFGLVVSGNMQIDVAGAMGNRIKEYSASIVYRFD